MNQASLKNISFCLSFITFVVLAAVLKYTSSIMIPFVLALFFTITIIPIITKIQKITFGSRALAFAVFFAVTAVSAILVTNIAGSSISELLTNSDMYQRKFIEITSRLTPAFKKLGFNPEVINIFSAESLKKLPIFSYIKTTTKLVVNGLSNFSMIAIFLIFLLQDSEKIIFTKVGIGKKISQQVIKYLSAKVFTSSVTGLLIGICLSLLGVEMAFMFGLLSFIFNFIPTIGSIVATFLPIPIILISELSLGRQITAIVVPGIIQFYVGNILEPKLMGKSLDLHPVTILLTLLIWGAIWRIPGMFLATPLTVILKIILEENTSTKFIAEIMAGRWPFYENLLAEE